MADESNVVEDGEQLDLSELKNFSFHADFDRARPEKIFSDVRERKSGFRGRSGGFSGNNFRKNSGGGNRENSGRSFGDNRRSAGKFSRGREQNYSQRRNEDFPKGRRDASAQRNFRPRFEPMVDVKFYPNDEVFAAVISALKATCKTYELFVTARLFLEKPERFAMVVSKKDSQTSKSLYLTNDDGFVFETENEAIAHVLNAHIAKYFDVAEQEITPPAGNFICLHRCGITGKDLCPPNYHKYQEILLNHQEKFLPNLPFQKFRDRIEKITDQQQIENWRAASAKVQIFTARESRVELKSDVEVQKYFVENLKSQAVTEYNSVRIPGEVFTKMPRTLLSKSIFVTLEREKAFPLEFSNSLRGRLRRAGFTIYKINGKSGVSYISGIKRKFRTVGDVFADDIQKIISCIDANPKISIASLCLQCACPAVPSDSVKSEADSSVEAADAVNSSAEEEIENQKFLRNLHWLIREGYVAEFENGTLIATEIMPAQKCPKNGSSDRSVEEESAAEPVVESANPIDC
ncbi:MAG: hypothetical protein LBI81_00920 [Puniceicoccales bacterium]|jgi:hypothetical protein|nr:hypothetical protein [Puniceicoccales bacterium]